MSMKKLLGIHAVPEKAVFKLSPKKLAADLPSTYRFAIVNTESDVDDLVGQEGRVVNPLDHLRVDYLDNAAGDILYLGSTGSSGTWAKLGIGSAGQFLKVGSSSAPEWADIDLTISTAGDTGTGSVSTSQTLSVVSPSGSPLTTTASSQEISIAIQDASTSQKGAVQLNADDFGASGGVASLSDTVVKAVTADTGSTTIAAHSLAIVGTSNEVETTASGSAGQVQIGLPNDVTIGNDLTVTGDLFVNGDQFEVQGETIQYKDNLFDLGMEELAAAGEGVHKPVTPVASLKDQGMVMNLAPTISTIGGLGQSDFSGSGMAFAAGDVNMSSALAASATAIPLSVGTSADIPAGELLRLATGSGQITFLIQKEVAQGATSITPVVAVSTSESQATELTGSLSSASRRAYDGQRAAMYWDAADSKFRLENGPLLESGSGVLSGGNASAVVMGAVEASSADISGALSLLGSGKIDQYAGSVPANGEILIGDGADFEKANLTAGEAIDITNGAGSITISCESADAAASPSSGNLGVAKFNSANFTVSSGFVSLGGTAKQAILSDVAVFKFDSDEQPDSLAHGNFSYNGATYGAAGTFQTVTPTSSPAASINGGASISDAGQMPGTSPSQIVIENAHADLVALVSSPGGSASLSNTQLKLKSSGGDRVYNVGQVARGTSGESNTMTFTSVSFVGDINSPAGALDSSTPLEAVLDNASNLFIADGLTSLLGTSGSSSSAIQIEADGNDKYLILKPRHSAFLNSASSKFKVSVRVLDGSDYDDASVPVKYKADGESVRINLTGLAISGANASMKFEILSLEDI